MVGGQALPMEPLLPRKLVTSSKALLRGRGAQHSRSRGGAEPCCARAASAKGVDFFVDRGSFRLGQEFDGTVQRISDHGIVVKLSGTQVTGFVHVSEMKDKYVAHPAEEVEEGEEVRVSVIKATDDFLGLSMTKLGRKGFDDYTVGEKVKGRVTQVTPFGAFVDIGAQDNALLHKTQMKERTFVADAREVFKVGDKVRARIRSKDEANGRLELSMFSQREVLTPQQHGLKLADLTEGQELGGTVVKVKDYGIFVDVGAEETGFVHVRNINDGIVGNIDDLLKFRDSVLVKVLGFRDGKLELTLASRLPRLPAVDAFKDTPSHMWMQGEIVGTASFGLFVDIEPPIGDTVTAMLAMTNVRSDLLDEVKSGVRVAVRIIEVDTEKRQVFVTMKPPGSASNPVEEG